jgi:hypothetical protein
MTSVKSDRIYFISGPVDITVGEFDYNYKNCIEKACLLQNNIKFVLGDSRGTDQMAQDMLHFYNHTDVIIYYIKTKQFPLPRYNVGDWPVKAFKNHNEKDHYMTYNSDKDILWIRPEEEKKKLYGKSSSFIDKRTVSRVSGTQKNYDRRVFKNQEAFEAQKLHDLSNNPNTIQENLKFQISFKK